MKLVRNKIPQLYPQNDYHPASHRELTALLKLKVMEEAGEVAGARNVEELTEELADLLEVIDTLRRHYSIPESDVSRYRIHKREELGGFNEGWAMTDFTKGES